MYKYGIFEKSYLSSNLVKICFIILYSHNQFVLLRNVPNISDELFKVPFSSKTSFTYRIPLLIQFSKQIVLPLKLNILFDQIGCNKKASVEKAGILVWVSSLHKLWHTKAYL